MKLGELPHGFEGKFGVVSVHKGYVAKKWKTARPRREIFRPPRAKQQQAAENQQQNELDQHFEWLCDTVSAALNVVLLNKADTDKPRLEFKDSTTVELTVTNVLCNEQIKPHRINLLLWKPS